MPGILLLRRRHAGFKLTHYRLVGCQLAWHTSPNGIFDFLVIDNCGDLEENEIDLR